MDKPHLSLLLGPGTALEGLGGFRLTPASIAKLKSPIVSLPLTLPCRQSSAAVQPTWRKEEGWRSGNCIADL